MKFNEDKKIFKLITQFLNDASLLSKQEEIIRKVLMTATKITNADYSSLLLLKNNPEKITYDYYPEEKEFTTHQSKARLSTGISGEVIRKKDIVEVEDLTELSTLNPVIQRRKWKSAIAVPIISRREVEGILYVAYYNERPGELEKIKELIKTFSNVFGIILLNVRLTNELNRTTNNLRISSEISRTMVSNLNLDELSKQIFKQITTHFGYELIALFIVEEGGEFVTLEYNVELAKEFMGLRLKIGEEGIVGKVAASGEPYYAPDVSKEPFYIPGSIKAKSEFSIPLKIEDRIIGVLDIESSKVDDFPKSTRDLLITLGAQIAMSIESSELFEETKRLSREDPLTGAVNRRILEEEIQKEISRAKRYKEKFSILFLDLDHFKEFNDNFGHPQGDKALKTFSKIIRKTLRKGDEFGRYGGDEFISVLYKTGTSTAREVAERLVKVVGQNKDLPDLTISVGIAVFPQDGNDLTKLVHNADNACYRAKNNGGNRVEFASKQ